MIEVRNLVKKYGNHLAVNNLSFSVDKRQVLGFLGPNGAGKSTTMNILTGYLSATEGSVSINGHDIFEQPELAKKEIGYLPETPPLYMDMTVYEYLKFVGELKGVPKAQLKGMLESIMETVKITHVSKRLIKYLSKGYKQRVGIAQALVGNPEVIILDEPTVGLDPKQIIEIRELIKNLSEAHTVILSSHILSEISAICDEVMIINKGVLIVRDTPENLSKRLSGAQCLVIRAKGTEEVVANILAKLDMIKEIVYKDVEEKGTVEAVLYGHEESDLREAVFNAFSASGCPLLMMKANELTLEEIFLQVTGDGQTRVSELNEKIETEQISEEGGAK